MTNTASPIPPESIPPETETSKIPTKSPQGGSSRKGEQSSYRSIIELVVRDLALRLKLDRDQIQVLSIESVEWVDAGLGCPLPGMGYAQVVTPGYRVTLEAEGDAYLYHTDTKQVFVLCREGDPALPVIPVDPDEIQDGVPWMPVDPLPTLIEGKDAEDPEPIK